MCKMYYHLHVLVYICIKRPFILHINMYIYKMTFDLTPALTGSDPLRLSMCLMAACSCACVTCCSVSGMLYRRLLAGVLDRRLRQFDMSIAYLFIDDDVTDAVLLFIEVGVARPSIYR